MLPKDDYNLRIIDFGLAEQLNDTSDHVFMTMCGTLEYMSPEVMDCKHASRASGKYVQEVFWEMRATIFKKTYTYTLI